jgi:predicted nucleic acid-binding protein
MILLDTNVLIYASTEQSPFLGGARQTIAAGWPLATAEEGRYRTYFSSVTLRTP